MWAETSDSEGNGEEQIGQLKAAGAEDRLAVMAVMRGSKGLNSAEGLGFGVASGLGLGLVFWFWGGTRRELGADEEEEEPKTRPWPLNLELELVRFFMNPFILSFTSSIFGPRENFG